MFQVRRDGALGARVSLVGGRAGCAGKRRDESLCRGRQPVRVMRDVRFAEPMTNAPEVTRPFESRASYRVTRERVRAVFFVS